MNEIKVTVNFEKGLCYKDGIDLISGDYNSTKLVFDFDIRDGTKNFEMKNPKGEVVLLEEIIDNEIILVGKDEEGNDYSLFAEKGEYPFEISLYKDDGKLTSVSNFLTIRKEQIKSDDEFVKPYLPVFDNLMKDVTSKGEYAQTQGDYAKGIGDDLQEKLDSGYFNGKDGKDGQDGLPGERGERGEKGEKGDKGEPGETPDLSNYYTSEQVDEKIDEETRDLLKTLSRELKPDEENGGFSSQTIVNVRNKSGATETIMEIDNLDVKTSVPVNSVLGTQKGIDMDDRIKALETQMTGVNERLDKLTEVQ